MLGPVGLAERQRPCAHSDTKGTLSEHVALGTQSPEVRLYPPKQSFGLSLSLMLFVLSLVALAGTLHALGVGVGGTVQLSSQPA